MKNYTSLSDATNDLKKRGYTEDFNLKAICVECPSHNLRFHPEDFTIDQFYRFEGNVESVRQQHRLCDLIKGWY